MAEANQSSKLVVDVFPTFAQELQQLLLDANEPDLAAQIHDLGIVDRCSCSDDFCASFYTQPKPKGSYGPGHNSLSLDPSEGMIIVDTMNGKVAQVEVLYRDELRKALRVHFP